MSVLIDWSAIWTSVAEQLDTHRAAGLEALITEDVLRFATVLQLADSGVPPSDLAAEWRRPGHRDSVDLVVTGVRPAAIEFKFPREPRETNAAWTQHLGEALKDFYRLATMPQEFEERFCVQLWSTRVVRYFDGVAERHNVKVGIKPGESTVLDPSSVRGLPNTALRSLERWSGNLPSVSARCLESHAIGRDLRLLIHQVDPAT